MYFREYDDLTDYVDELDIKDSESLMVFVGDRSANSLNNLITYLNGKEIKFFGGIYAGLLVQDRNEREGFIVKKFEPIYSSMVFPYMMRSKLTDEELKGSTAIVLIDGLSSRMKDLTDTVYNKLGTSVKYVGGGAGFSDLIHRPCIFNNNGIFEDAMYICIVKADATLAVEHGWKKLRGPFFVNKSQDNVLSELNSEHAFDVYKQVIEQEDNIVLSREDFFRFSKDHPFGIDEGFGNVIVRDPIGVNENDEIICVASIPEECEVYILKGNKDLLLSSSLQITKTCLEKAPDTYEPLLFDCISRAMFLEDDFSIELNNIKQRLNGPVEGALSIGEIASRRNGQIVIHNKSTILALLHKEP